MIVDLPLIGPVEMTPEAHARYVASMTKYYEGLPPAKQPECWREEREEREAIVLASEEDFRNRSIFSKVTD